AVRHAGVLAAAVAHVLLLGSGEIGLADATAHAHRASHSYGDYLVPSQPFSEMSKITPSGSLYLTSKLASSLDLPSVKKNLPPPASTRFFVSSRPSPWKQKWCAPTKPAASLRPDPASPLYLSSARLITPSER